MVVPNKNYFAAMMDFASLYRMYEWREK
jgi:hypothetical protein